MNINCLVIQCYISLLTIFVGVTQPRAPNHLIQTCTSGPVLKGLSPTNPGLVVFHDALARLEKISRSCWCCCLPYHHPMVQESCFWASHWSKGGPKEKKHDGGCRNSKQMMYRAIRKTTKQMPHKTSEFSVMSIYVSRLVYLLAWYLRY